MTESADEKKDLMNKLSSMEDIQNLFQLDVINLNNEIEKLKLSSSETPIPPATEEKIIEMANLSKDADLFKKWRETIEEVRFLREKIVRGEAPVKQAEPESSGSDLEGLRSEILEMREMINAKKSPPHVDLKDLRKAIEDNRKAVENLKLMITGEPKSAIPDIESIRKMTKDNRRLIEDLKLKMGGSSYSFPSETHGEVDKLHAEVEKLEQEIVRIKGERSIKTGKDDIENLKKELFTKLGDLNVKFGPKSSDEVKKAMEANRTSIEKLKSLISGEETSIEEVKKELEDNRKFMNEIKGMLFSKKPSAKVVVPPDPDVRKRLSVMEQKMDLLGRRLERMSNLKPIKIPEFAPPRVGKPGAATGDVEGLKKEIDMIISRLDGFLTKDEIEKGFLEKRLKSDEKLITGEIYKEMNDIKKAILRNEDQIHTVASDVERVKKEVNTVEKGEWSKLSDIPALEDLKKRIDELERKIQESHGGPLFIE